MKKCRKCGKDFPIWLKIDGKGRNLNNRKLCLDCSPFGCHNTRPDPSVPRKSRGSEKRRQNSRENNYRRAWGRKKKLLEMSGEKCKVCSYNKCQRALHFHHRNPEDKKFGLTLNNIWGKTWETIEEEWHKCDLVCSNCHMEIEEEICSKKDTRYQRKKKEFYQGQK